MGGSTHTHTHKKADETIQLISFNQMALLFICLFCYFSCCLLWSNKNIFFKKTPSSIPLNFSTDLIGQGGVIEGGTRRRRNGPGTMTPASGRKEGEKESKMKSEK